MSACLAFLAAALLVSPSTQLASSGLAGSGPVQATLAGGTQALGASIGTPYCFGDGSGGACPCGNTGAVGRGCNNSGVLGGARIQATGVASVSNDSVSFSLDGLSGAVTVLLVQGSLAANGGQGFPAGDGFLCIGGSTRRLIVIVGDLNAEASYPNHPAQFSVSTLGGVPAQGGTRYYSAWHREHQSPCGSFFNFSNGLELVWTP